MLPAKYSVHRGEDDNSDDSSSSSPSRRHAPFSRVGPGGRSGALAAAAPPPLGLTGVVYDKLRVTVPDRGTLSYTVFRPNHLRHGVPALVCVPGGPLLPSTYLQVLVHGIVDRSLIFYDHIGAGQSEALSRNVCAVDLTAMVQQDLPALLQALQVSHVHLLGHSFGGVLAFEYCKAYRDHTAPHICSLTLVNTPCSMAESQRRARDLQQQLRIAHPDIFDEREIMALFRAQHECRLDPLPLPLQQSLQMAGYSNCAQGLLAVQDYRAEKVSDTDAATTLSFPPTLVVAGQHDFCDASNWIMMLPMDALQRFEVMANCGHYCLLEDEPTFAKMLGDFIHTHDPEVPKVFTLPNGVQVHR